MREASKHVVTILFAIAGAVIALPLLAQSSRLPSEQEVQGLITLCAGGRSKQLTASISLGFKEWRNLVGKGDLKATVDDLGAVLSKIPVDAADSEIYKTYTTCVKDQIKEFLKAQDPQAALEERYRRLANARLVSLLVKSPRPSNYWSDGDGMFVEPDRYALQKRKSVNDDGTVYYKRGRPPAPACHSLLESLEVQVSFPASNELGQALLQCWESNSFTRKLLALNAAWESGIGENVITDSHSNILKTDLMQCAKQRTGIPERFLHRLELTFLHVPYEWNAEDASFCACCAK